MRKKFWALIIEEEMNFSFDFLFMTITKTSNSHMEKVLDSKVGEAVRPI